MLLLDENDKNIVRKYRVNFDDHYSLVEDYLIEYLKKPIIVSRSILEDVSVFDKESQEGYSYYGSEINDMALISTKVCDLRDTLFGGLTGNVLTETVKYSNPFTIGFILNNFQVNRWDYIKFHTLYLSSNAIQYAQALMNMGSCTFNDLSNLLLSCGNTDMILEFYKSIKDDLTRMQANKCFPDIDSFATIFSNSSLIEETDNFTPFSILTEEDNLWRYEEADRELIEHSIALAKKNDDIIKTLKLTPNVKKNN